jgi:mannose-1-phosphate guanylyltransferase
MAGGSGTRFWPLSRARVPKQVLSILGPNSLLQETVARLDGLISREQTFLLTNARQKKVIAPQLEGLTEVNYVLEPSARNTAACIGLAAIHIRRRDPEGVMVVLPSDHLVRDIPVFQKAVRTAVEVAEKFDALVTFGIPPTRPETGYGYVQFSPTCGNLPKDVHQVKAFAEKPNKTTAARFVASGDFYWNSGIFVWKVSRILKEMEDHLPEMHHQLQMIDRSIGKPEYNRVLANRYGRIRPISIDYGIMEVATSPIYMVEGKFGWSDVGSWDELYRQYAPGASGNVIVGEAVTVDASGNFIHSPGKMTAVIGLNKVLVVNTKNAVLICPLERAQDVKMVVEKLRREGKDKYL